MAQDILKEPLPLVTIGIPVYNVGRFIGMTIKSVLNQTYRNFELIITDDGSTDKTVEEIRKFNDARIKLLVDGENRGISYRLNQQIKMAKGKYFVRMDGDDLMFPDRIEKQINYLRHNSQVDVVGGHAVIIGDENEMLGIRYNKGNFSKSDLFRRTRFIHPTVTGKTEWFKRWLYRDEMSGCEDMDLWIRSADDSVFADLDRPVLFYRDPLKFKLKTYLYRQKKIIKGCWRLRNEMPSKLIMGQVLMKALVSSGISISTSIIGKDKQMVARRNKYLDTLMKNKYEMILNDILR